MRLERLTIGNFRLVRSATLELAPGANLLVGENAQGKTTVLEAVSLLATGRSFRAGRDRELVSHDAQPTPEGPPVTAVDGRFESRGVSHALRGAISGDVKAFWFDGKAIRKLGDLWGVLNVVVFIPADLELVRGGPAERRALVDSLLARASRYDLTSMQSYGAALKHRNALLRHERASDGEFEAYETAMAEHGARLLVARHRLLERLAPLAEGHLSALAGGADKFQATHETGLPQNAKVLEMLGGAAPASAELMARLTEVWRHARAHDRQRGFTQHGPHRGDVGFVLNGRDARSYASQGQTRSIVLALRLAEVDLLERLCGEPPVLLLDDVLGELDRQRTRHFVKLLSRSGIQALITATDAAEIERDLPVAARFEVKAGGVSASA